MIIPKPHKPTQRKPTQQELDHDLCGAIEGLISALEFARETPIPMDSLKEQLGDLVEWIGHIKGQVEAIEEEQS